MTILITSGYPLSMQVDDIPGRMILETLKARGLKVQTGVKVNAFEGNGSVQTAITDAGERLPCDMVIIGKGVLPAHGFIPKGHLKTDLGIPPVLHMGSCVDNVRILVLLSALADALGVDLSDLPVAGSAPEWYSEKAVTIGVYFLASGVTTHLGPMPPITGSMNVINLLTQGLNDVLGAAFNVEPDPEKAAIFLRRHIEEKRRALGLEALTI